MLYLFIIRAKSCGLWVLGGGAKSNGTVVALKRKSTTHACFALTTLLSESDGRRTNQRPQNIKRLYKLYCIQAPPYEEPEARKRYLQTLEQGMAEEHVRWITRQKDNKFISACVLSKRKYIGCEGENRDGKAYNSL